MSSKRATERSISATMDRRKSVSAKKMQDELESQREQEIREQEESDRRAKQKELRNKIRKGPRGDAKEDRSTTCYLRIRESDSKSNVEMSISEDSAKLENTETSKSSSFQFDGILSSASQEEVFDVIGEPMSEYLARGYNTSLIVLGQKATGKTYTVFGSKKSADDRGLAFRVMKSLIEKLEDAKADKSVASYSFGISGVQITPLQEEKVYDLSTAKGKGGKTGLELTVSKRSEKQLKDFNITRAEKGQEIFSSRLIYTKTKDAIARDKAVDLDSTMEVMTKLISKAGASNNVVIIVKIAIRYPDGTKRLPTAVFVDLKSAVKKCFGVTKFCESLVNKSTQQKPNYQASKLSLLLRDNISGNYATTVVCTSDSSPANYASTAYTLKIGTASRKLMNEIAPVRPDADLQAAKRRFQAKQKQTESKPKAKREPSPGPALSPREPPSSKDTVDADTITDVVTPRKESPEEAKDEN